MEIDRPTGKRQTLQHKELFLQLSDHMPKELIYEREMLVSMLKASTGAAAQPVAASPGRLPADGRSARQSYSYPT
jgi:hypothetical protein